jgi:hypothetical protein
MSDAQLDVEETYDVHPTYVLPDLTYPEHALAHTRSDTVLDTLYYDTEDLRLTVRGTTLRRRIGGTRPGWQLRLPAAGTTGTEAHRPLCEPIGAPPDEFRRQVQIWVGDRDIGPVTRIRTERVIHRFYDPHWCLAAEIRDDRVSAEALGDLPHINQWRELEVETIDDDRRLLHNLATRLVDAGAEPATNPSKLARALGPRLDDVRPRQAQPRTRRPPTGVIGHLSGQGHLFKPNDPRTRTDQTGSHDRG